MYTCAEMTDPWFLSEESIYMRFREKLLIAATLVFVIIVAAGIYISQQSMEFKAFHESFVRTFVANLSRSWELQDIADQLSEEFLEQAKSVEGQEQLEKFSTLGVLNEIKAVGIGKYFSGSDGTFGEFLITARFEREEVLVKVTVHEQSGQVKVRGVTINRLDAEGNNLEF